MKKIKYFLTVLILSSSIAANQCYESNNTHAELIENLIKEMSIQQKVGQIIQGDLDFVTPSDLKKYKMGSVLNGGNTSPNGNQYADAEEWKAMSKALYDASPVVNGIKIPFIWGTDAVHGHNNLIGATVFPHNIGLGATGNAELMEKIGSAVALEVLSTGVVWTFAPALSVPRNDRWGRTYEGFSEDPKLVGKLGSAFVRGLQGSGDSFLDENHILATSKHFAGDGGTFEGIDQGDVRMPREQFEALHVSPYYPAIDSCTQTIMSSFNSFQGKKLHGYNELLTDLLKDEMAFDGSIVGDWNGHGQVEGCSNANCPEAFNAGVDIYMAPDSWKDLHRNLLRDVKAKRISMDRLDDAVRRILQVKARLGLFDGRKPHEFSKNYLGAKEHKELGRQAVRESLVLLKNNNSVLPLNPKNKIGVIGVAAKEIRFQTGGWTLDWQGKNNKNIDFPGVHSIFESIKEHVLSEGGSIEFSEDGSFDSVSMIYNKFVNAITQNVVHSSLIPAEVQASDEDGEADGHFYDYEPEEAEILGALLPQNLSTQLFSALLESSAAELAARMTAMDNATRNAGDMIDRLTLVYNRTRQANITKELIEIISGAEAL